MASADIRTTVAFDPATVSRWERLSRVWGVSKSEALRRALEKAETGELLRPKAPVPLPDLDAMTPGEIVDWMALNPMVSPGWAADFRREIESQRKWEAEQFQKHRVSQ